MGGVLMGLANLVPGISGGTMLLAAGIYPRFIRSVAEISTFRFRMRSIVLLACVGVGAVAAIVTLAGTVKDLVVYHQWIMYSLFIGLTLGGVPLLWKMVKPADSTVVVASIAGILAMVGLVVFHGSPGASDESISEAGGTAAMAMLLLAGVAGGSAMILPGLSGSYLLLVLGQYVVILGAIATAADAASARDWAAAAVTLKVIVPVGVGVIVGIVGVSNVVKLCLDRFPRATLGFLLGLLLGAVVGLWPFQQPSPEVLKEAGDALTEAAGPTPLRLAGALCLVGLGFTASMTVSRLGGEADGANGR
jgi:putative membrane protein